MQWCTALQWSHSHRGLLSDAGEDAKHWTSVHWDSNMVRQPLARPSPTSLQRGGSMRPPRPFTAPNGSESRALSKRPSHANSSVGNLSGSDSNTSSDSDESDSDEPDSRSSSDPSSAIDSSRQDSSARSNSKQSDALDESPEQLPDRCLRPLSKLQQASFMPAGQEIGMAEPHGLIWQNSGFMTPFTPEILNIKRGQSRQMSTAATGLTAHSSGAYSLEQI